MSALDREGSGAPGSPAPDVRWLRDRNGSRWTFTDPVIRQWTVDQLDGAARVLNLCCGKTRLRVPGAEIVRVDLDETRAAEYHFDAVDVAAHFEADSFDAIVCDPPWADDPDPMIEHSRPEHPHYEEQVDNYSVLKDGIATVLAPGGVSVLYGYDSSGLGSADRPFEPAAVALINFTGNHRDVVGVAEQLVGRFDDADAHLPGRGSLTRCSRRTLDDWGAGSEMGGEDA